MRRLGRILFNAVVVMSLLLCVATLALWVESNRTTESLEIRCAASNERGSPVKWVMVESRVGRVVLLILSREPTPGRAATETKELVDDYDRSYRASRPWRFQREEKPEYPEEARWLGFGSGHAWVSGSHGIYERRRVVFPHWFAAVLLAMPTGLRFVRRRRQHGPGHCPGCGYDLRATPERCPECGREEGGKV